MTKFEYLEACIKNAKVLMCPHNATTKRPQYNGDLFITVNEKHQNTPTVLVDVLCAHLLGH